jgi:hypothetical protein
MRGEERYRNLALQIAFPRRWEQVNNVRAGVRLPIRLRQRREALQESRNPEKTGENRHGMPSSTRARIAW